MAMFEGKTVLITGGARGQGRSHALAFAREGADVAFCDIARQLDTIPYDMSTPDDLAETVEQVEALDRRCVGMVADVRDMGRMNEVAAETIAELGTIDFCLANAGVFGFSTVAEMTDSVWSETIDTNLTGTFHTFRAVLPHMIERGSGRIVATSSMAGKMGFPNIAHYVASKWGVIGLVKSTAMEVAANGINVNAVCPTTVNTTMIKNKAAYELFLPESEDPTEAEAKEAFQMLNAIPVPWVEPEDISATMLYLCSEGARYITGETIAVAAGQNAGNAA